MGLEQACMKTREFQITGKPGRGIKLEAGMTLAIEPMVIMGKSNILQLDDAVVKENRSVHVSIFC